MAAPWADYGRLAELGSLQPLTALGAAITGVATWKPGAYSPLVCVRGTVASAGWLGEILLVMLQEDGADGRRVGLMLKPRCGLDVLRALVGARCQPAPAPTGRGKLPLKEYRRQQRQASQAKATDLQQGPAPLGESSASDEHDTQRRGTVRLEVEAFVEKSKVQFLLRNAPPSPDCAASGLSTVLPVILHPANARWSPAAPIDADSVGVSSNGDDILEEFSEWQECGLEPSGSGSNWTATGETQVQAIDLSDTYLAQLRAAKNGEGQCGGTQPDVGTAGAKTASSAHAGATASESEDDGGDFVDRLSREADGIVLSKAARTRQLYNQRKHHRTKAKKCRFAEFAKWVTSTFPDEVLYAGRGCLDVAGGKGSLAYELAVTGTHTTSSTRAPEAQLRRSVECTVVDTHPVLFSQFRTKEFLHLCGELASSDDSLRELERRAPADVVTVRAARRKQHGSLVGWLDPRITADETRASQLEDCRQVEPFVPLYQVKTLFDDTFLQAGTDSAALFQQCGFVLGLHPDQATEPIVDACLAADKAFAVVPCCVFPEENPDRKVRQRRKRRRRPQEIQHGMTAGPSKAAGTAGAGSMAAHDAANTDCGESVANDETDSEWEMVPVRSIEQFVQYLVDKDAARVRTTVLDAVPGRNTIVWYCPGLIGSERSCNEAASSVISLDARQGATEDVATADSPVDCPVQVTAASSRKRAVGEVL